MTAHDAPEQVIAALGGTTERFAPARINGEDSETEALAKPAAKAARNCDAANGAAEPPPPITDPDYLDSVDRDAAEQADARAKAKAKPKGKKKKSEKQPPGPDAAEQEEASDPNEGTAPDDGLQGFAATSGGKKLITEGAVADAFAAHFGAELRYCHHTGKWFQWAGSHWKKEETKLAYRWAHEMARAMAARSANFRAMIGAGRAAFAAGVERLAQAHRALAVTSEIWDSDPWLLGTPGGTVDLRTGVLRSARQEDFITKITAVAPAETPECPLWLKFLEEATNYDTQYIRFLGQWCGYSLTGDIREDALLFIFGPGKNGKTVYLNTQSGIMADYCTHAAMDTFTASHGDRHPTDLAMLRGARMVCAAETEQGRQWAEARIKQLLTFP